MLYTFDITAAVGSTRKNPVTKELKIRAGRVTKIGVLIPPGHHCTAHLVIKYGETTVIPWGEDQTIHGDGEVLEDEPDLDIPSEPAQLRAVAWNDGSVVHTFYLRVWVDPRPKVLPIDLIIRVLERLDKFLGRVGF